MKKSRFSSCQKDISSILNRLNTTVLVISLFVLTAVNLLFIYVSTVKIMTTILKEQAKTGAKRIEWVVKSYKNIAQGIGCIPELSATHISTKAKEVILANKAKEYKLIRSKIVKTDGYSDMDDHFRGDRDYFKEALKGNVSINDPIISRTDGKLHLIIGAPVWKSGIYNGRIDSVLFCAIGTETINNILREFEISPNSNIYMIGKNGTTIASLDEQKVLSKYSNIKESKNNRKLKKIAEFEEDTLEGKRKSMYILRNGSLHTYSSHLIDGTPGWALIIDFPVSDFLSTFRVAMIFIVSISIAIIFVSRQLIRKHSRIISEPVKQMAERLRQASIGDFKTDVNMEDSIEEIKIIASATQSLINRMDSVLNGISSDFATSNLESFINFGDYIPINENFEKVMKVHLCLMDNQMNKIVGSVNDKSEKSFSAAILINNKSVGKYVISPAEDCTVSDECLQVIVNNLANLIGHIIGSIISREIQYKALEKNNLINSEKNQQLSENLAKELLAWAKEIKENDAGSANLNLKKNYEILEKKAIAFNRTIHENAEFSRFTNFNYTLNESDYNLSYLLENIEIRTGRNAEAKDNITISATERPEEVLFGDREAIEKIVTRIILYLESKNPGSHINTICSVGKDKFGHKLQFKFIVENYSFSEEELKTLTSIETPGKHSNIDLQTEHIKIVSAYNLLWHLNGSARTLSADESVYKLLVEIPQL